jgi:hypothetical protein
MTNKILAACVCSVLLLHFIISPVIAQGLPSKLLSLTTEDILSEPSQDILPLYYDADLAKKTPTPTLTNTLRPTDTPTNTPTFTHSPTPSFTPRNTPTPSPSSTPRFTPTPTVTRRIPASQGFSRAVVIILLTILLLPLVHRFRS